MRKLNNKGFTLTELIATILILGLVVSIGSYSIVNIINSSKEKDYELLVREINNSIETYYQECNYVDNNCQNEISLGFLVTNGYLKGNSKLADNTFTLVNPNDGVSIVGCLIKYSYSDGDFEVLDESNAGSCPKTSDYEKYR